MKRLIIVTLLISFISSLTLADINREDYYQDIVTSMNPLVHYTLNETGGSVCNDISGNAINGIYVDDPNLIVSGLLNPAIGSAVELNAINDYIEIPDGNSLDLRREISFSFWLKVNSFTNTWTPLVYKATSDASTTRTYGLFLNNAGYLHLVTADSSGQQNADTSAGTILAGNWYHIAGIIDRNAGELRIYVNGQLKASGAVRTTDTVPNSESLYMGYYPLYTGWGYMNGIIDEFALYDYALTEEQVYQLHDAITGPFIIDVYPKNLINLFGEDFDSIRISFNEPIDFSESGSGSFWLDDIVISNAEGSTIEVNQIVKIDDMNYEAHFDPVTLSGTYTIEIGPDFTNLENYLFDQDGDGTLGEHEEDVWVGIIEIDAIAPTPEIYFYETNSSTNLSQTWPAQPFNQLVVGFSESLGVLLDSEIFHMYDPNGTGISVSIQPVYLAGAGSDPYLISFQEQTIEGEYTLIFDSSITDTAGNPLDGDGDGVFGEPGEDDYIYSFILGIGPCVISQYPQSIHNLIDSPFNLIELYFSEPLDFASDGTGSFWFDDIVLTTPEGLIAVPQTITSFNDSQYYIGFDDQFTEGVYTLAVGPDVNDLYGNLLDQDKDGVQGDTYISTFYVTGGDVIFYEGFETPDPNWIVSNGVWQIGEPTSGPGSAYNGTNVAGTVLSGDYPYGTDSYLISPTMDLPSIAGGEEIILRFSQWFNYDSADSRKVRIQIWEGTAWSSWTDLTSNTYGYSKVWSLRDVDLSAYAEQRVRIAFYHEDNHEHSGYYNEHYEDPGWFIDDVEVLVRTIPVLVGLEDFESGWNNWHVTNGIWQWGEPTSSPSSTHSPTHAMGTVMNANYTYGTDSRLVSPQIQLPTVGPDQEVMLTFWQYFNYQGSDSGKVQINVFSEGSWSGWSDISTYQAYTYSRGWCFAGVDLTAYKGQRVRFGFVHDDNHEHSGYYDEHYEDPGWFIDDLEIIVQDVITPDGLDGTFESGQNGWYSYRGVWQIGVPSSGPGSAYSGTNVAGTVLGADYPYGTDSSLISPTMDLPSIAEGEEIVLRFAQWFNYDGADVRKVRIRTWDGASWSSWTDLTSNTYGDSSIWSLRDVDLSAYAGQRVRIAFYHEDNHEHSGYYDEHYEDPGWFIDDVEILIRPIPVLVGLEDFESGWNNWYATNGIWQWGEPTNWPGSAHSSTHAMGTVINGNYTYGTDSRLVSPQIQLPTVGPNQEVILTFWQYFNYQGSDSGKVQINVFSEGSWSGWSDISTYQAYTYSRGWCFAGVDLTAFSGQQVKFGFWHDDNHEHSGYYDEHYESIGWYIDDLEIIVQDVITPDELDGTFESGQSGWYSYRGVWQIGEPSSGPGSAYSGTNIAGTVLGADYPYGTDSSLISPTMDLPSIAEGEEIVLRFAQWFNYDGADVRKVRIRTWNGASWSGWTDLTSNTYGYSKIWSLRDVDLSAYAGQRVRIAFYHEDNHEHSGYYDEHYEDPGWFVDDVEVLVRAIPMLGGLEDFEFGWNNWYATNGIWQWGEPTNWPGSAHSSTHAMGTVINGNYTYATDSRLVSPQIQLPTVKIDETLLIRFWFAQSYSSADFGKLQISQEGQGWIDLDYSVLLSSGQWKLGMAELSEYAGNKIRIAFLHNDNHEHSGYYDEHYESYGWYIDDVHLNTFSPNPMIIGNETAGTLSGTGDRDYYVVQVPPGGHLQLILDDLDDLGSNEVYLRHGALPTAGTYDYKYTLNGSADQEIFIPSATAGYWYILVTSNNVPTGGSDYTLRIDYSAGVMLDRMTPDQHGNAPDTVLTLFGAGFTPEAQVDLMRDGAVILEAQQTDYISGTQFSTTFDFDLVDPNDYQIRVTVDDSYDELPFMLVQAVGPKLETNLIVPSRVGYHNPATIWVEYANTGDTAMSAPLLVIGAKQNGYERAIIAPAYGSFSGGLLMWEAPKPRGFWTYAMPEGYANTVQILASGDTAGLLQPGEKKKVPIQWAGWQKPWNFSYPPITFTLGIVQADNSEPINWTDMKDDMRPDSVQIDTWEALWSNFIEGAGLTWGQYIQMLHDNAEYLGKLGLYVNDVSDLLAFEFAQADGLNIVRTLSSATDAHVPVPGLDITFGRMYSQNISNRYRQGVMGRGWSHNWDYWLEFVDDGTIKMHTPGGGVRIYQPDSRTGRPYFSMEGDHAVFQAISAGYSHIEANGLLRVFDDDGKLTYVEDTNGNQLQCSYTGTLLTRIKHSNGKYLDIGYNSNDMIETVTDMVARQTTYVYDAGNQYLTDVIYFDGKSIIYTYDTGSNVSTKHALTSITYPGSSHQYFDYTPFGKLESMYKDGQEEKFDFDYDTAGMIAVACACTGGNQTKYYLDHNGMLAKVINPLNEGVFLKYDGDHNLTSIVDPAGRSYNYTYNDDGELIHITDPLGNGTRLGYFGIYNRLTSLVDANGNLTQYDYDDYGNLESITYDDDSVENWTYDELGNPEIWTNRRGTPINYIYDPNSGFITSKICEGSTWIDYEYDERDNLVLAIESNDPNKATVFDYNDDDQLIQITYPQERWLAYTYNDTGQRETMTNQLGHVLTYYYDDVSRLEYITDETTTEIVHYYYDQAGRLEQKTLGNDVYTLYTYDPAGRLETLTNYKSNDTILSGFEYTYDSRGRRDSITTTYGQTGDARDTYEGTWLYEYDDLGQLTAWTDPTGRRVEYTYDALGNRIIETDDGTVIDYTTNNLNQYTQVGDTTYIYDDDGNMTQKIESSGTTIYTYNDDNKLIAVLSPDGNWLYTYDAFGNRIRVDDNGAVIDYVIDPSGFGNVVGEYNNPTGDLLTTYDHGFGLLSQNSVADGISYYTYNAIGSTQDLTSPAQQIINSHIYEPFGKELIGSEPRYNPFKFVGEFGVMKERNSLSYMRVRYYVSQNGIFTQKDPMDLLSGDFNLYKYASNNPVQYIDPRGLLSLCKDATIVFEGIHSYVVYKGYRYDFGQLHGGGAYGWDWHTRRPIGTSTDSPEIEYLYPEFYAAPLNTCRQKAMDWYLYFCDKKKTPPIPEEYLPEDIKDPKYPSDPNDGIPVPPIKPTDPNKKYGPKGFSEQNFVPLSNVLPYKIEFENDPNATAPAQIVEIIDPQDANLDWTTFELTEIGFGDVMLSIPEGSQHYETTVPFSFNGVDFDVEIGAGIDLGTGEVYAYFYSVDPWTGLPPVVDVGFLPPEDGTGRGMGYISYNIKAKQDLVTGTEIRNVAYITFDYTETIATNQVDPHDPSAGTDPNLECLITIDADLPDSYIEPLEAESLSPVTLVITGDDVPGGSGIGSYDIYVSDNGGEFTLWQSTSESSIEFSGEVDHTYAFYSVAKDNAGNYEERPEIADTTTLIVDRHLNISSWSLLEIVRAGRTTYDYIFAVNLENTRDQGVSNVDMTVTPQESNVELIDGEILISDIPANSIATSTDTITLRVDYADPTPTIQLTIHIDFDSTVQTGQALDFTSYILIGTNSEIGDITGDNQVDMDDLMVLCEDWLSGNSLADIAPPPNGDGIVNFEDFKVIAENWLITID